MLKEAERSRGCSFLKAHKKLRSKFHKEGILIHSCVISYLVCAGGSSTAWEGADPGATTAAVPIVTGKALAGWTAPLWGSWGWTTGMGAIWMIWMSKEKWKPRKQLIKYNPNAVGGPIISLIKDNATKWAQCIRYFQCLQWNCIWPCFRSEPHSGQEEVELRLETVGQELAQSVLLP